MNRDRIEGTVQILILLAIGAMAGAASFTHVHDWTMTNVPSGTGDWFGWANAVISELTPTAAGLEIRRRKRHGDPVGYPMAVLIAAATISIAAQLAQAKPGPTGYLLAALPALAFLALSKLVLSRSQPARQPITDGISNHAAKMPVTGAHVAIEDHHAAAAEPIPAATVPAELLTGARMAAFAHRQTTGQPITATALAEHLGIPHGIATAVLRDLHNADDPDNGSRP